MILSLGAKTLFFLSLLTLALSFPSQYVARRAEEWQTSSSAILFQAFHWESANDGNWYTNLKDLAPSLKALHITHAWLPPPADSGAREGYLPRRLSILDSSYGSTSNLRDTISSFSSNGIVSVYDAVFNHRVGSADWCDFTEPNWPSYFVASGDEACHTAGVTCSNPKSSPASSGCANFLSDTGENYPPARDLDYANPEVIDSVKRYLCQLRADVSSGGLEVPYGGIRFDFVRGYSSNVLTEFSKVWTDNSFCTSNTKYTFTKFSKEVLEQTFCVAENWVDGLDLVSNCNGASIDSAARNLEAYSSTVSCGVFDFATKFALTCALNNNNFALLKSIAGSPSGLIGSSPLKAITFIDNHDTGDAGSIGKGQRLLALGFDGNKVLYTTKLSQAYAYLLTHPGSPSIFHPHFVSFGAALKNDIQLLTDIRSKLKIKNNSGVFICQASSDGGNLYSAYISPSNDGFYNVAMKIGSKDWCPFFGTGVCAGEIQASGNNWAVWAISVAIKNPNCFAGN
ncbi:hypothetical protein HK096_006264 [Nowakowskiella sp. JEL0078]|nr:hypothetical protein HK096_006264 [Nowakowskiella sp. JEL0078]